MPAEQIEDAFVRSFVTAAKRDRILGQLASVKNRAKFRKRLAHDFIRDLDQRFAYHEASLPRSVARRVESLQNRFARDNPAQLCYVLSEDSNLDGQRLTLADVTRRRHPSMGTIVIMLPELAYYWTEDNDPDYVLVRPETNR